MDSDFKKIFSVGEVSLDVDKKGFKYIISTYATVTYEDKWGSVERDNVIIKSMEIIDDIIINRYVADMVDNYKEGQQPAAHILIRLKNTLHYAKEPYTFKILDELIVRFEKITKAEKLKIKLANEENRLERVKAKLSNGDLSLNKVVEHIEECIKNCEHIELETFYKSFLKGLQPNKKYEIVEEGMSHKVLVKWFRNKRIEYSVHTISINDELIWGHYFDDYENASEYFNQYRMTV